MSARAGLFITFIVGVIFWGLTLGLLAWAFGWIAPDMAHCYDCVATFCGSSAECLDGCFCAIPMGEATGYCVGTR